MSRRMTKQLKLVGYMLSDHTEKLSMQPHLDLNTLYRQVCDSEQQDLKMLWGYTQKNEVQGIDRATALKNICIKHKINSPLLGDE